MRKVSNGSRFEDNGWIRVSVSGTPKQRGFANGALTAKEIAEVHRMLRWFIPNSYGVDYDTIVDIVVTLLAPQIENNFPEYYEEMTAIAAGANSRGADVTLQDILFWNCYYSVSYMMDHIGELIREDDSLQAKYGKLVESGLGAGAAEGGGSDRCTAFIAVGDYTRDGKIVCAHNTFDNFIDSQYCNVMLSINPSQGNAFIMQTAPGCIASGTDYYVNSRGMICTETTIGGFSKYRMGDPICCRIRQAIQYGKTLDDYVDILKKNNSGDYANSWLLGDIKTNTIMRIELGLDHVSVEKKKNGYFIGFNAPYDDGLRCLECVNTGFYDIRRHQGARRVRLTQLMEKHKGNIDVKIGEDILADHYDVYLNKINMCSRTCCSHYNLDDRAFMSQADRPLPYQPRGAMDGIVTDTNLAKKMGVVARWGSSCGTPFVAAEFCDRNLQWADQKPYLLDRPSQAWTVFTAGKTVSGSRRRKDPTSKRRTRTRR
tara:strand:+ start:1750 stop:3207 length:1458 start_codon:yes stop_codon:yes gene_type:complete